MTVLASGTSSRSQNDGLHATVDPRPDPQTDLRLRSGVLSSAGLSSNDDLLGTNVETQEIEADEQFYATIMMRRETRAELVDAAELLPELLEDE